MLYSVLDAHGNRYGPVDLPTLNQWVRDGRIVPATQILVEATQKVIPATMVPGLNLEQAPGYGLPPGQVQAPIGFPGAQSGPYAPANVPYPRSGAFSSPASLIPGGSEYNRSLTFSGIGLVACICFPPIGAILCGAGIYFARAAQINGHPSPGLAYLASIGGLAINIVLSINSLASIGILSGLTGH